MGPIWVLSGVRREWELLSEMRYRELWTSFLSSRCQKLKLMYKTFRRYQSSEVVFSESSDDVWGVAIKTRLDYQRDLSVSIFWPPTRPPKTNRTEGRSKRTLENIQKGNNNTLIRNLSSAEVTSTCMKLSLNLYESIRSEEEEEENRSVPQSNRPQPQFRTYCCLNFEIRNTLSLYRFMESK